MRTSENSTSEPVWKIGMGPEIGVPKAVERGQRGPDQPLLAAEEARSKGLGLFSKQFLEGEFCEVRHDGVLEKSVSSILHRPLPQSREDAF